MDIQVLASSSSGNCYRVSDGNTTLLLECGISIKEIKQKLNYNLSSIDFCCISHEHGDHSRAVKDIIKAGIDCYMSAGTKEALGIDGHRVHVIEKEKQFIVGSMIILPLEAQHDAAEPLAFLIYSTLTREKMLFITDSYYCKYVFKDLNYIMVEANYSIDILLQNIEAGIIPVPLKNRILQSHFSLENVKKFLSANDLTKVNVIYLLHLSGDNSDAERVKREIAELTGKLIIIA